jgi:30S ribosomal protein S31
MGRGDKKTKRGKIFKGSFGKSRPARPAKAKKIPAPLTKEA